jgi:hypothetical protein
VVRIEVDQEAALRGAMEPRGVDSICASGSGGVGSVGRGMVCADLAHRCRREVEEERVPARAQLA